MTGWLFLWNIFCCLVATWSFSAEREAQIIIESGTLPEKSDEEPSTYSGIEPGLDGCATLDPARFMYMNFTLTGNLLLSFC